MKIKDNHIKILKSIKILMHEPERSNYPFKQITETFKLVVNMKQKDNESLLYYSKILKQAKETSEAHSSKDILVSYVENI